jgi:hypothetical protein
MIAFRFLAAFASIAAVLALPTPHVALVGNELANDNSIHGVANGNSINLDTRDATIAAPVTPDAPAAPEAPATPAVAVPAVPGLDLSKVTGVEVNIKVQLLNIVKLDLTVSIKALVEQIRVILSDTTTTVEDKVSKVIPLVLAIVACLTGVIAKIAAFAVAKAVGLVGGPINELTNTLNEVITLILTVLCEIVTVLGVSHDDLMGPVQNVLSLVNGLVICIVKIVPLNISVASILATIPGAVNLPTIAGIN